MFFIRKYPAQQTHLNTSARRLCSGADCNITRTVNIFRTPPILTTNLCILWFLLKVSLWDRYPKSNKTFQLVPKILGRAFGRVLAVYVTGDLPLEQRFTEPGNTQSAAMAPAVTVRIQPIL